MLICLGFIMPILLTYWPNCKVAWITGFLREMYSHYMKMDVPTLYEGQHPIYGKGRPQPVSIVAHLLI